MKCISNKPNFILRDYTEKIQYWNVDQDIQEHMSAYLGKVIPLVQCGTI